MRSALVFVSASLLAYAAAKQPITGADVLKIRNITTVVVATDGSFAVYAVQSMFTEPPPDPKGEPSYKYRTHLWRIDLNDPAARPEQLTFGDRADASPLISPDNRTLAFVRTETLPGKNRPTPQIWLLPLRGSGEARAITSLENGATAPVWRPDGKAVLVTSGIPLSKVEGKPHFDLESPQRNWFDYDRPSPDSKSTIDARPDGDRRALRNWLARNASKDNPAVIDRINFLGEQDLAPEIRIGELFTIDLSHENKATQITKDYYNHIAAVRTRRQDHRLRQHSARDRAPGSRPPLHHLEHGRKRRKSAPAARP